MNINHNFRILNNKKSFPLIIRGNDLYKKIFSRYGIIVNRQRSFPSLEFLRTKNGQDLTITRVFNNYFRQHIHLLFKTTTNPGLFSSLKISNVSNVSSLKKNMLKLFYAAPENNSVITTVPALRPGTSHFRKEKTTDRERVKYPQLEHEAIKKGTYDAPDHPGILHLPEKSTRNTYQNYPQLKQVNIQEETHYQSNYPGILRSSVHLNKKVITTAKFNISKQGMIHPLKKEVNKEDKVFISRSGNDLGEITGPPSVNEKKSRYRNSPGLSGKIDVPSLVLEKQDVKIHLDNNRKEISYPVITGNGPHKENMPGDRGTFNSKKVLRAGLEIIKDSSHFVFLKKSTLDSKVTKTEVLDNKIIKPVSKIFPDDPRDTGPGQKISVTPLEVNKVTRRSSGLIFKENVHPEKKSTAHVEHNTKATKTEDIKTTNIPVKNSPGELNAIADKVYNLIETKLLIEKERRGF